VLPHFLIDFIAHLDLDGPKPTADDDGLRFPPKIRLLIIYIATSGVQFSG
jgi:hypothetical protein